jgi:predicted nucleic acid-binding protein
LALVVDTGPLIASLDRQDSRHLDCAQLILSTSERIVIPSPVLVETDYWIHERLYAGVFVTLLEDILDGTYTVEELVPRDYPRIRELCAQHADADIGFVDAAVLAIVERLGEPKLATMDHRHFGALRPRHVPALVLLP